MNLPEAKQFMQSINTIIDMVAVENIRISHWEYTILHCDCRSVIATNNILCSHNNSETHYCSRYNCPINPQERRDTHR